MPCTVGNVRSTCQVHPELTEAGTSVTCTRVTGANLHHFLMQCQNCRIEGQATAPLVDTSPMGPITVCHRIAAVLGLCLATASFAQADIFVDRAILEFSPSAPAQTLLVGNGGDEPVYVVTSLTEVLDPASATPQTRTYEDLRRAPVIANPQTLLLQPGQRKLVRVFVKEAETRTDRVYKLTVKPYIEDIAVNRPISDGSSGAIKVSLGYNILLLHRPEGSSPNVEVSREGGDIVFFNAGNTNVLLKDVRQCPAGDEVGDDACESLGTNRLYAGERWRIDLPNKDTSKALPVRARFITVDKVEDLEFK